MLSRLVLTLVLLLPTTAWANDPTPEPSPSSSTPEPTPSSTLEWDQTPVPGSESWNQEPRYLVPVFNISGGSYTPPPEASRGYGGWAIVHPGTGYVHAVIVASIEYYYVNTGRMQIEYAGCPAGCLLRFQTMASADGNVVGLPSSHWNKSDQTFTTEEFQSNENGSTKITRKFTPSKTSSDEVNNETGLVTKSVFTSSQVNGLEVKLTLIQDYFNSDDFAMVEFQNWKNFSYKNSPEVSENLSSDVEAALVSEGYKTEEPQEDGFVDTIKKLTTKVIKFFTGF
jgi:hypothetical protein